MKSKFIKTKEVSATKSVLGAKLELIALQLAEEILDNSRSTANGDGFSFDEKLGALKTLTTYYATVSKVDPPEDEGNGFAQFRGKVASANSSGGGSESPFDLSGEIE